jgi:hypothetical protein
MELHFGEEEQASERKEGQNRGPKVQALVAESGRDGWKARTAHRTDRAELILHPSSSSTQSGGTRHHVMRP